MTRTASLRQLQMFLQIELWDPAVSVKNEQGYKEMISVFQKVEKPPSSNTYQFRREKLIFVAFCPKTCASTVAFLLPNHLCNKSKPTSRDYVNSQRFRFFLSKVHALHFYHRRKRAWTRHAFLRLKMKNEIKRTF